MVEKITIPQQLAEKLTAAVNRLDKHKVIDLFENDLVNLLVCYN